MSGIDHISSALRRLAENQSQPFCYTCYVPAPSGKCDRCMSDDLMRLVPEIGVEFGLDWVVNHLVSTRVTPVNVDESFDESIASAFPESVKIGWLDVDVASAIKQLDPVSWSLAQSAWLDDQVSEGQLITLDDGSNYYHVSDIELLVAEFGDEALE